MNKSGSNYLIEYLPLNLILSYFLFHNIILVLIGIALSMYLINMNSISKFAISSNIAFNSKKAIKDHNKDYKILELSANEIELSRKEPSLTLVETIEELGFIPSLDENDDKNAA